MCSRSSVAKADRRNSLTSSSISSKSTTRKAAAEQAEAALCISRYSRRPASFGGSLAPRDRAGEKDEKREEAAKK
ncbi:hypothetical protein ACSSS7_002368 [Eimeria intestinalis]